MKIYGGVAPQQTKMKKFLHSQVLGLPEWKSTPQRQHDCTAYLSSGVDVSARVADGDSTDDLAMAECTQLPGMTRDAWTYQRIGRERHWLQLTVGW